MSLEDGWTKDCEVQLITKKEKSQDYVSPLTKHINRHVCFFIHTAAVHLCSSTLIFGRSHSPSYVLCVWAQIEIRKEVVRLIKSLPEGGWEESHCGCLRGLEAITMQALNNSKNTPTEPFINLPTLLTQDWQFFVYASKLCMFRTSMHCSLQPLSSMFNQF